MAPTDLLQLEAIKKKRAFKKFSYRGVDLEKLLDLSHKEVRHAAASSSSCVKQNRTAYGLPAGC
jgi:hypothetical protein